tara:strand:+ start:423 stop:989 length:567 start_codon:yes stop_codon:yes gene_type:complete
MKKFFLIIIFSIILTSVSNSETVDCSKYNSSNGIVTDFKTSKSLTGWFKKAIINTDSKKYEICQKGKITDSKTKSGESSISKTDRIIKKGECNETLLGMFYCGKIGKFKSSKSLTKWFNVKSGENSTLNKLKTSKTWSDYMDKKKSTKKKDVNKKVSENEIDDGESNMSKLRSSKSWADFRKKKPKGF